MELMMTGRMYSEVILGFHVILDENQSGHYYEEVEIEMEPGASDYFEH